MRNPIRQLIGALRQSSDGDPAKEIIAAFKPLLESRGFTVTHREPQPQPFGNTLVTFASARVRLRVTRDRSQFLSDFAPVGQPAEWFDLDVVMELAGGPTKLADGRHLAQASLQELSALIQQYLPSIEPHFSGLAFVETKQRLRALREERARRLFGA